MRRKALRSLLETARARGELGSSVDAAVNLLLGSFQARYLESGSVPTEGAERVVGTVWPRVARENSRR
jgi:hypothetical protein